MCEPTKEQLAAACESALGRMSRDLWCPFSFHGRQFLPVTVEYMCSKGGTFATLDALADHARALQGDGEDDVEGEVEHAALLSIMGKVENPQPPPKKPKLTPHRPRAPPVELPDDVPTLLVTFKRPRAEAYDSKGKMTKEFEGYGVGICHPLYSGSGFSGRALLTTSSRNAGGKIPLGGAARYRWG
eukprot:scaffold218814_cov21-Tisochrysis_lutea.AAC.1